MQLIKLALPMILGNFAILSFDLVDAYFVSQLGAKELAVISFIFPISMVLGSVAVGLGTGVTSLIAQTVGKGKLEDVSGIVTDGLLIALVSIGSLCLLSFFSTNYVFSILGAGPELFPLIKSYMGIWYIGMIFVIVPIISNAAILALGNTLIPSLILITGGIINLGFDPLFIFGWSIFPPMGLTGAALATLFSRFFIFVFSLIFLQIYRKGLLGFTLGSVKRILKNGKSLLHIGLPATLSIIIRPISLGLIIRLVSYYGAEAVAGFGIALKIQTFSLVVVKSLSASMISFVGQNWKAMKYYRVKKSLILSFLFCLFWGLLLTIIFNISASHIVIKLTDNLAVATAAIGYMRITSFGLGALGISLIFGSVLNASKQPLIAVSLAFIRELILYFPLAFIGGYVFGINGIFGASLLSNLIVAIGILLWLCFIFKVNENINPDKIFVVPIGLRRNSQFGNCSDS